MAWISIHEEVDGPKLRRLYTAIGCSKFEALGVLTFVWFWGLKNADETGLVRDTKLDVLSRYLYGCGDESKIDMGKAVQALVDTGWIDMTPDGFCIHDWDQWQEQWYKLQKTRAYNAERKRNERRRDKEKREALPVVGEPPAVPDTPMTPPEVPAPPGDPPAKPKKSSGYAPAFEQFWKAYPRKIDKGNAYQKYQARIKDGFSEDELLQAAQNYAAECKKLKTEAQYIKHPKTFLSDKLPFTDYIKKERATVTVTVTGDNPFAEWGEHND